MLAPSSFLLLCISYSFLLLPWISAVSSRDVLMIGTAMASPRPKVPPSLLLLVVAFSLVAFIGFQTLKDRRISADLIKDKNSEIEKLSQQLQAETKRANGLQGKLTKLTSQKEKLYGQKEGLSGQLIELERVKSSTEQEKRRLESSLQDKENEVSDLKEKLNLLQEKEEELKFMKDEITQKDNEIKELKLQLKKVDGLNSDEDNVTVNPDTDSTKQISHEAEGSKENTDVQENMEQFLKNSKESGNITEETKGETDGVRDDRVDFQENAMNDTKEDIEEKDEDIEEKDDRSKTFDEVKSIEDKGASEGDETEETSSNDEIGETEKSHEEETEDQPDVDIDSVNKADLEENEMAAME